LHSFTGTRQQELPFFTKILELKEVFASLLEFGQQKLPFFYENFKIKEVCTLLLELGNKNFLFLQKF